MNFPIASAAIAMLLASTAGAATLPAFDISVTLSKAAAETLTASKETITLSVGVLGQMKKPKPDEDPEMGLGEQMIEIPGAGVAHVPAFEVQDADLALLDGEPQVLVNVFSSRKSSTDNVLDCGIWQDVVSKLPAEKIEIACKLIGEE